MAGGDYASLTPVVPGAVPDSWGEDVRDSVILRFATAAARDAVLVGLGAGDEGLTVYLKDSDTRFYWDGAAWHNAAPRIVGAKYSTSDITSSGAEVALAAWAGGDATVAFVSGRAYELKLLCGGWNAGTAGQFFDNAVKIRKTVNSTAAQQLGSWRAAVGGGSSPIVAHTLICYVHNATAADIAASLGLTVTKSTGGNATLQGGRIIVTELGATARLSAAQLTAMDSIAIT
jgi:hypothetical protein